MSDILHAILETEKECAGKVDVCRKNHDMIIKNLIMQFENKMKDEKKKIISENSGRYKIAAERAENEIRQNLIDAGKVIKQMHENRELCEEVRDKVISILFYST